jgi:putative Mn2+ efflux pump MntP
MIIKGNKMFSIEVTMLGVALAIDAAVASFAVGILNLKQPLFHKFRRGSLICLLFGFFQALMIWFGSQAGYYLSFSSYGYLFQLIVATIFIVIGLKVLQESLLDENKAIVWGFWPILIMAVATSIDALVSGVSLGTLPSAHMTALEIGLITFGICSLAYGASFFLKSLPEKWLLRLAAVIFFFLGGKVISGFFF